MQQVNRKDAPVLGNMILATAKTASKSSGSTTFLLIIVVLIVLFYFVMIRPQRNRQRKVAEQQNNVVPGARVRTTAGMYATVIEVDGNDVLLEVAPGVEVRYIKRAIMEVLPDEGFAEGAPEDADLATEADDESDAEAHDESEGPVTDEGSEHSHVATDGKTAGSA
jgi:preprotein translocase subunit YajC